jgi:hypothetical protein
MVIRYNTGPQGAYHPLRTLEDGKVNDNELIMKITKSAYYNPKYFSKQILSLE